MGSRRKIRMELESAKLKTREWSTPITVLSLVSLVSYSDFTLCYIKLHLVITFVLHLFYEVLGFPHSSQSLCLFRYTVICDEFWRLMVVVVCTRTRTSKRRHGRFQRHRNRKANDIRSPVNASAPNLTDQHGSQQTARFIVSRATSRSLLL